MKNTKPLGRRPGAPDTAPEILNAARFLFSERGYTATSVRAIARHAGVDPALVHHYYGTKEHLFRAALDIPFDPEIAVASVVAGGIEAAPRLLPATVLQVWDDPQTGPAMLAFVRRALADAQASSLMKDFVVATVVRQAAAGLLPDVDTDEAQTRMSLVFSHMLGVVVARTLLGVPAVAQMSREDLVDRLSPVIEALLQGEVVSLDLPTDPTEG